MEDLLRDVYKEASGPKFTSLRKSCQDALEELCNAESGSRRPSHELRRACLQPLQVALETKKPKLVTLALNGFHKMLRDDRFHRGIEPEDDSLWMPAQILCATASITFQSPDTQVHIFRLYLSLALCPRRMLNGRLCVWTCGRCAEAAGCAQPVPAAARAAAAQTLRAYCAQLDEEYLELLSEGSPLGRSQLAAVSCYSEVIPVIQYLCGRLSETQPVGKQNPSALFFLECLLTLVSSLSEVVSHNSHFTTFLWQKFCPALISYLGTPALDKNFKPRDHECHLVDDSGRGSGALASAPSFNSKQVKAVYSIANQLVRLVGSRASLRPVLEALYHRTLLYPPVGHRLDALRSARDLLQDPRRLAQLVLIRNDGIEKHSDDMAIIRLIMDSVEECGRSGDAVVAGAAAECVVALLSALERLCAGSCDAILPAAAILAHWPALSDADYTGPLTYQSLARLPSPYRDVVAGLQNADEKDSDSTDTSGPENNSSEEANSDDEVFLPTRPNCPTGPEQTQPNSPTDPEQTQPNRPDLSKAGSLGRGHVTECNADLERNNAKQFVKTIQSSLLPKLMSLRTSIEVDEAMQDFASKCCCHNASLPAGAPIMNADGVYLASYAALLLNLRLARLGYYSDPHRVEIPVTENEFVEDVRGSGALVYLSATWLRELYQQVLARDLLEYTPSAQLAHPALVHLLIDLGGLEQTAVMSDWQRLKDASMIYCCNEDTPQQQAGLRWARRILTCIWDSMVTVLSIPLSGYSSRRHQLHGLISKKMSRFGKKKRQVWEGLITLCLEGLHKAARISNTLCLQNRCSNILALLANSAISQPPNGKILSIHALSLDILITSGLELGARAPDCWEHIFAACQYVSSVEHALFGQQGNTATPLVAMATGRKTVSMLHSDLAGNSYGLDAAQDLETCVDVFSLLQPSFDSSTDMTVAKIVETCQQEGGSTISGANAARVCCALAGAADTLCSRLAATTTLPTLKAALSHLTRYEHRLLFSKASRSPNNSFRWWRGRGDLRPETGGFRALCRTGDLALRCLRASRPLAHRMAIWTIVAPHFLQAACHKDLQISSLAIQCMHDCITALLNQQVELPHFHFNEALLKPFENLLCLELCDADIQEQIICCICEFVETNRMEIRSGWRPLFNTLRVANNSNQYSAILEVFKVFLSTDNTLVFANAALDCILCLLSHIKGLHIEDIQTPEDKSTQKKVPISPMAKSLPLKFAKHSKFVSIQEENTEKIAIDMCKEALHYLENCANILTTMYSMPKCPVFNTGNRVRPDVPVLVVDPIIPTSALDLSKYIVNNCHEEPTSYRKLSTSLPPSQNSSNYLLKLDRTSNILKVWYVLIEGLISATVVCSKPNQPAAMETLFKIIRKIIEVPGAHFGFYCINHLLLPAVQNWLRQLINVQGPWDDITPNFKQFCGMTTDTVVEYLHHAQKINIERANHIEEDEDFKPVECNEASFALKEILLILVECVGQPQESIARLGASCIRHIILTSGHLLTENQWEIVCISLHRACNVSLTPLKQITLAFNENSDSFYGDLAIVKVAARRDCTINDNVRLHAMAQQVFFNDSLRNGSKSPSCLTGKSPPQASMLIDDRSYVFLIYLKDHQTNSDLFRISHRGLIIGLLAHQILVQIIATILIQTSSDVFQGVNSIIFESFRTGNLCNSNFFLGRSNVNILLKSLEMSYGRAMNFDARPGLKFLVQKVSNLDYAANLYKQTTSSWLIKVMALTDIFLNEADKLDLSANEIFDIIGEPHEQSYEEQDNFILKTNNFKTTWELLCMNYVKHLISTTAFDHVDEVKITDKTSISGSSTTTTQPYDNESLPEIEDVQSCFDGDNTVIGSNKTHFNKADCSEESTDTKPFTFADFKNTSVDRNFDDNKIYEERKIIEYDNYLKEYNDQKEVIEIENKENCKFSCDEDSKEAEISIKINKVSKKVIVLRDSSNYLQKDETKLNPETLIPPQPVPPEIEQQRNQSMAKDAELKRTCFQNIILAYLELILTFSEDRFSLIFPVLHKGFYLLSKTVSDPLVLERVNAFLIRKEEI